MADYAEVARGAFGAACRIAYSSDNGRERQELIAEALIASQLELAEQQRMANLISLLPFLRDKDAAVRGLAESARDTLALRARGDVLAHEASSGLPYPVARRGTMQLLRLVHD